jgi:5-methylcytosine-specific restriction endonuclease McrA
LVAGKGQAHIDHIEPHNEDRAKFYCDDRGLQTLCVNCHNSKKQAEERRQGLVR